MDRQIIAIGGLTPGNVAGFYRYILEQVPSSRPRISFLPTASADSDASIAKFYQQLSEHSCTPSHLPLFGRVADPEAFLVDQDIIMVGGGNTKSMLGLWREWGVDDLLRQAWDRGVVLCGFSAGAICWFEQALCDAWADRLAPVPALGFLPGSCCPHYRGEPDRRPAYHEAILQGAMLPGLAIDDNCAVHFKGIEAGVVISATEEADAFSISREGESIEERSLVVGSRIRT